MFQETMEKVIQGLNIVMCYINNILMTDKTDEEQLMNLVEVSAHLQEHGP